MGRPVVVVVVERIAGRGAEHGNQSNQGEQAEPAEPGTAAHAEGQSREAERAGEKHCPGDRAWRSRVAGGVARAVEPATVARTIELVTAAVVLGRISRFSGVKVQEAWSGRPEQERVTNMGAVRDAALIGVTEAMTEPDWPAVSESVAGATVIPKSGRAASDGAYRRKLRDGALMGGIAGVDGGEAMLAGKQRKGRSGMALGVERHTGQAACRHPR